MLNYQRIIEYSVIFIIHFWGTPFSETPQKIASTEEVSTWVIPMSDLGSYL